MSIPAYATRNDIAPIDLTDDVINRARGAMLGAAVGDALGVPYEFGTAPSAKPRMKGGGLGPYEPGEWSDDTQTAICIAQVAATGLPMTGTQALNRIGEALIDWMNDGATDMGTTTRTVLSLGAHAGSGNVSEHLASAARALSENSDREAGCAALTRSTPLALAQLGSRERTVDAAQAVARLTHYNRRVDESVALWTEAVRRAVVTGDISLRAGFDFLVSDSAKFWRNVVFEAENGKANPAFNNFTVGALQSAWKAVWSVRKLEGEEAVRTGIENAVKIGGDTDGVASLAGALLGAAWGESCIPTEWKQAVHGWPSMTGDDIADLGERIVRVTQEKTRAMHIVTDDDDD